jgi:hypothetical protein
MDKKTKKSRYSEIDTAEFIYDGKMEGFAGFIKAVYSDYLLREEDKADKRHPGVETEAV